MSRYEGLQTVLEQGGRYGCLFLCLCSLVEEYTGKPLDIIQAIYDAQAQGWLGRDFYCKNQLAFLHKWTGKCWRREDCKEEPLNAKGWVVEKWVRGGLTHFKRPEFDVYTNSRTVREGKIEEWRIYVPMA